MPGHELRWRDGGEVVIPREVGNKREALEWLDAHSTLPPGTRVRVKRAGMIAVYFIAQRNMEGRFRGFWREVQWHERGEGKEAARVARNTRRREAKERNLGPRQASRAAEGGSPALPIITEAEAKGMFGGLLSDEEASHGADE